MQPGTIIVLNGTTSAGKTSVLRAMQRELDAPYLEAGIDTFLFMLPGRWLDFPLWDEVLGRASHAGPMGLRLFSGMHRAIRELSLAGNNVLADHALVEPAWVVECAALLADLPAYLVGVQCAPEVTAARELARGDRTPGQAARQQARVHAHGVYDFVVDTTTASPDACAAQIIAWLAEEPAPMAWRRLASDSGRSKLRPYGV